MFKYLSVLDIIGFSGRSVIETCLCIKNKILKSAVGLIYFLQTNNEFNGMFTFAGL